MTFRGHKKHADIPRPAIGKYGRYELAIIGAPCSIIKKLVVQLGSSIDTLKFTYIDADHQESAPSSFHNLTDKIGFHRLESTSPLNDFDQKILLGNHDVLLVNGNHFTARRQIVICHPKKKESLQRKLDRLTDVALVLLAEDEQGPYDYLREKISDIDHVPVLPLDDVSAFAKWIIEDYTRSVPPVKGLILAGGRSQRMGEDKASIQYHGVSQLDHAARILSECSIVPAISCRRESDNYPEQYDRIYDTFDGLGPFGGILSAFRSDPDSAWLVVACDQPLLSSAHLGKLLDRRDPSKIATCFHNPETGFPEPLITLWEPKAYSRLLSFLSMGYSCPRKVLINSDIEEIKITDTLFMRNANTPEERKDLLRIINSK